MSLIQSVRKYCLDCAGESSKEVALCQITECPLWPYRFGVRPRTAAYKERMAQAVEKWPVDTAEMPCFSDFQAVKQASKRKTRRG